MQSAFIRNRTEEFGHDVWSTYVLPLYFGELGLNEARKSCVFEGGRGCGKTALLRYLSYQSQFSTDRPTVPADDMRTVGLYLKADAQYFSGFVGNGLDESKWMHLFDHALCLSLAEQVVGAVRTLNCNIDRLNQYGKLKDLNFSKAVQGFATVDVPSDIEAFEQWIRVQRQGLSRWFKNFDTLSPPMLLPMREFVGALIGEIRSKLPYMAETVFAVYVDEYENLLDYQQRFLNTLIKVGEPPLIFHVAMKPNGMRTRATTGTESIQETADYRLLKLDDLLRPNFKLFAAELFFFRLIREAQVAEVETPVSIESLRSLSRLPERANDEGYQRRVLSDIERILPGLSYGEVAKLIFIDETLRRRWQKIVEDGLKLQSSKLSSDDFFKSDFPEASVICAALLHQRSKGADMVKEEFGKLVRGEVSDFREGEWIHHLLVGTLLLIYMPFRQRPCPIYGGFDAFTKLACTNVRHFLELCHLSIGSYPLHQALVGFSVSVDAQAIAAHKASIKFRNEVSSCGDSGNRLLALVNFLGKLFRLSQARFSQSEAERTHFSIVDEEVSGAAHVVIREAIKWSVLFDVPETKVKSNRFESNDYILNPIYAPFFGLSFNKGRKLEIKTADAEAMLNGQAEDYTQLLRKFEKTWAVDGGEQLSLDLSSS